MAVGEGLAGMGVGRGVKSLLNKLDAILSIEFAFRSSRLATNGSLCTEEVWFLVNQMDVICDNL